jgi:hypothetical protein
MAPEVKVRKHGIQVRRTQLAGSTRRLAPLGQANYLASRGVVVSFIGHPE